MNELYYLELIYIAKIILHHNSKNIKRILTVIVNCELWIATYVYKLDINNFNHKEYLNMGGRILWKK
jgi:hypothetical protein